MVPLLRFMPNVRFAGDIGVCRMLWTKPYNCLSEYVPKMSKTCGIYADLRGRQEYQRALINEIHGGFNDDWVVLKRA
jgi:hypothetical protein